MHIVPSVCRQDKGVLAPRFETIPKGLSVRPRWGVWRAEPRDGKLTKRPFSPTGIAASVSDPTTWGTYQQAVHAYRTGAYDGVGIVLGFAAEGDEFVMGSPLSGLDLDGCVDPATRQLTSEAHDILVALNTYAEVSPSGTGVKAFVFGRWKPGRHRAPGVEIYDAGRYFTVTGRHVSCTPFAVMDRQSTLELLQTYLFGRARR